LRWKQSSPPWFKAFKPILLAYLAWDKTRSRYLISRTILVFTKNLIDHHEPSQEDFDAISRHCPNATKNKFFLAIVTPLLN
jgi:hypothetical protein